MLGDFPRRHTGVFAQQGEYLSLIAGQGFSDLSSDYFSDLFSQPSE
jgi:hypothetical protein